MSALLVLGLVVTHAAAFLLGRLERAANRAAVARAQRTALRAMVRNWMRSSKYGETAAEVAREVKKYAPVPPFPQDAVFRTVVDLLGELEAAGEVVKEMTDMRMSSMGMYVYRPTWKLGRPDP